MSDTPFLGELRLMSFNFAPSGWAECNGQLLPINQNQPLFSLLGTMYGGNGQTTFALPDLRGRAALHRDGQFTQGSLFGEENHTLNQSETPAHNHFIQASKTEGDQASPSILASAGNFYRPFSDPTTINPGTLANAGGSQAHNNMPPYLVLNWSIALIGIFPSRN
jgi:microcystin-dependent protein